jgi:hypothetical protein
MATVRSHNPYYTGGVADPAEARPGMTARRTGDGFEWVDGGDESAGPFRVMITGLPLDDVGDNDVKVSRPGVLIAGWPGHSNRIQCITGPFSLGTLRSLGRGEQRLVSESLVRPERTQYGYRFGDLEETFGCETGVPLLQR